MLPKPKEESFFIDEIDKIAVSDNPSITRDVSGEEYNRLY
jgi:ATP-dependent protease Clp ATPase subunit